MKAIAAAALAALLALPAAAAPLCDELGFAGLLAACNKEELPPLTLAAGKPLADAPWQLWSGVYYEVEITSDGSQELALAGPAFFALSGSTRWSSTTSRCGRRRSTASSPTIRARSSSRSSPSSPGTSS